MKHEEPPCPGYMFKKKNETFVRVLVLLFRWVGLSPNSSTPRPQVTAGGPENHDEITSEPDTKFQNISVIRSGVGIA